jgi:DNA-binding response OmpR family regulator
MASDIRRRVVVIEDDEGVVRMIRFSLRSEGFDATEVTTGSETLHSLERDPPDATVLDLQSIAQE